MCAGQQMFAKHATCTPGKIAILYILIFTFWDIMLSDMEKKPNHEELQNPISYSTHLNSVNIVFLMSHSSDVNV